MSLIFRPTGTLDLNTDPSVMESGATGNTITGGEMQRCKNLHLNQKGVARTRYGSSRITNNQMPAIPEHIREQNGTRYALGSSIYQNESSIASGYSSAAWSSILYNSYNSTSQNIFALNGSARVRISGSSVYNWGIAAPTFSFTLDGTGSTGLTGDYNCKFTLARLSGTTVIAESNPGSAVTTAVSLTDEIMTIKLDYDAFSDLDSQATHLRLYRTTAGGLLYYFDQSFQISSYASEFDYSYTSPFEATDAYISGDGLLVTTHIGSFVYAIYSWESTHKTADDSETRYVRTAFLVEDLYFFTDTSDSGLGSEVATNHDRPPAGSYTIGPNFNGTCFILYNNLVYFSLPKQPEYWPATYFVEVSPPQFDLTSAVFYNGQLYVATKFDIYSIPGAGAQTFFPVKQASLTGAQGRDCMYALDSIGIFHMGTDGVYLFSASAGDQKFGAQYLDRIFRGETVKDIPGAGDLSKSFIIQFKNKIYIGYAATGNTYPAHVFVFDMSTRNIVYYNWGFEISAIAIDYANDRLICTGSDGYMWHIEDRSKTADNTTEISWDIESQDYTLQTRAHFPRWIKYDVDASGADQATGALVLDGSTLQSHSITGNRNTKRRLITTGNGERCSMRITGSGPVSIHAMESE